MALTQKEIDDSFMNTTKANKTMTPTTAPIKIVTPVPPAPVPNLNSIFGQTNISQPVITSAPALQTPAPQVVRTTLAPVTAAPVQTVTTNQGAPGVYNPTVTSVTQTSAPNYGPSNFSGTFAPQSPAPTPAPLMELRKFAEDNGIQIGWDANTGKILFNGVPLTGEDFGLTNVNGRYMGTIGQMVTMWNSSRQPASAPNLNNIFGQTNISNTPQLTTYTPAPQGTTTEADIINQNPLLATPAPTAPNMYDQNNKLLQDYMDSLQIPANDSSLETAGEKQLQADLSVYDQNINLLQEQYNTMMNNPPVDHFEQIDSIMKGLQAYKGIYSEQIGSLIASTLGAGNEFSYDPNSDAMLKDAVEYANSSMMEQMNARGILNSTITADNMRKIYKDLLPQYTNIAYQRYNDNLNNQFKKLDVLNSMNEQDYDKYLNFAKASIDQINNLDAKTYNSFKDTLGNIGNALKDQIQNRKDAIDEQRQKMADGYAMLNDLGYVNNKVAQLTGLEVGSLSAKAKETISKNLWDLNTRQIEIQAEYDKQVLVEQGKLAELEEKKKEAKVKEANKTKATAILVELSNMPAQDAMAELMKNSNVLMAGLGDEYSTVYSGIMDRIKFEAGLTEKQNEKKTKANEELNKTKATAILVELSNMPAQDAMAELMKNSDVLMSGLGANYKAVYDGITERIKFEAGQAEKEKDNKRADERAIFQEEQANIRNAKSVDATNRQTDKATEAKNAKTVESIKDQAQKIYNDYKESLKGQYNTEQGYDVDGKPQGYPLDYYLTEVRGSVQRQQVYTAIQDYLEAQMNDGTITRGEFADIIKRVGLGEFLQ